MSSIHLFSLAQNRINFLGTRQMAISQNIANMSTPGYRSVDVKPFKDTIDTIGSPFKTTHHAHISASLFEKRTNLKGSDPDDEVQVSGNNVNIESELIKSGDVRRLYDLTSSSMRMFQRMYLNSVK